MTTLAIFASGRGSNAAAIIERFTREEELCVGLIVTNSPKAGVLQLAEAHGIPAHVTNRREFYSAQSLLPMLHEHKTDFIALAGFLWLVPEVLLIAFPAKIINIHPALLPMYGGKGMYGQKVHEMVKAAGDRESGITIHYVDEQYDNGEPIFQMSVKLTTTDTSETIASKVLQLEHHYYPEILVQILTNKK